MGLAALLFFYIGVLGNFQFVTDMAGVEFETEVTPSLGEKADSSGKTETQPPPTRPARLVRAIEGGFFFVFSECQQPHFVRREGRGQDAVCRGEVMTDGHDAP